MNTQIDIKNYLSQHAIEFKEHGDELIINCVFCTDDKHHLYINAETTQYDCKKCGAQGNIFTLMKHLDGAVPKTKSKDNSKKQGKFKPELAYKCHENMTDGIRSYLNKRGIGNDLIEEFKIGVGEFYGRNWITIPIKDETGEYAFLKLRKSPTDNDNQNRFMVYPEGSQVQIFNAGIISQTDNLTICEGEFDCMILHSHGIPAISSSGGGATFKQEWSEKLKSIRKLYMCFDNDDSGQKFAATHLEKLAKTLPKASLYNIALPKMDGGKDVTDYFTKFGGTPDKLFELAEYAGGRPEIDTNKFKEIGAKDLIEVMNLTIKKDDGNKVITFLCMLSAYTESSQFNISFNAPSSTGKSYIPTEVAKLFPTDDLMEIGYVTATAFFHDNGEYDKKTNLIHIDLSRKIIIFLDQPHTEVLERLRPLLSHDKKNMLVKITDKSKKGGNSTKNVLIKGYPSVIFCSAGQKIDEQEGTRFILLSPEIDQEKIRQGIEEKIKRETDKVAYEKNLNENMARKELIERIEAIRQEKIDDVKIANTEIINKIFLKEGRIFKPRHQRDVSRLLSIIKAFTLLNLWHRERIDNTVMANEDDIASALKIWQKIQTSQEHNISPYVYEIFEKIIIPCYEDHNINKPEPAGVTMQQIKKKFFEINKKTLEDHKLRQQILPALEEAGLLTYESDEKDRRKKLFTPSQFNNQDETNSESGGGVNNDSDIRIKESTDAPTNNNQNAMGSVDDAEKEFRMRIQDFLA